MDDPLKHVQAQVATIGRAVDEIDAQRRNDRAILESLRAQVEDIHRSLLGDIKDPSGYLNRLAGLELEIRSLGDELARTRKRAWSLAERMLVGGIFGGISTIIALLVWAIQEGFQPPG